MLWPRVLMIFRSWSSRWNTTAPARRWRSRQSGSVAARSKPDGRTPRPGRAPGALLNHFIRPPQHRLWDRQPECLGGLEVDREPELRRLFDRQIGGLGTLENLVDVAAQAPPQIAMVRPVRHQRPCLSECWVARQPRKPVLRGEGADQAALHR